MFASVWKTSFTPEADMHLERSKVSVKVVLVILSALMTAMSVKPAVAGSFIEIEGRFIIIMGRAFCLFNCDELKSPPMIVRQPAILPPKPR